jgi:diguanylate cyclase (GGDEF)-like protein
MKQREFMPIVKGVVNACQGKASSIDAVSPSTSSKMRHKHTRSKQEQFTYTQEHSITLNTGEEMCLESTVSVITDEYKSLIGYIVVLRDVTERQKMNSKMRFLAQHDSLTGLPNRLLLEERINQAMILAKRHNTLFAILYVDMNAFKEVNDRYGHQVGDELLCSIAKRISANIRESDTVSRHGGDEFVVLLSEIEYHCDALNFAVKLSRCLKAPHLIKDIEIPVHISIGISIFPHHGSSHDVLLAQADRAMFVAKAKARACRLPSSECASAQEGK